jgi:Double-GTPase 2
MTDVPSQPPPEEPATRKAEQPDPPPKGDPGEEPDAPRIDDVLAGGGGAEVSTDSASSQRDLALDNELANVIAARHRPTVLVLAGGVGCGKTSVYAGLYERLGRGRFAGWMFAGSSTIPGFEERCHYWRKSAGRTPGMKHTQGMALPWLHIRLRDVARERQAHDFLLGDFDGELFEQLVRNEVQPAELRFLRRADHLGVVVDGEEIADAAARPAAQNELSRLIAQLAKNPSAAPPSFILVVTKLDVIEELDDPNERAQAEETINSLHEELIEQAGSAVSIVRLAVRSRSDRFPLGHGLEDLLSLLSVRPATKLTNPTPEIPGHHPLAEFRP